jgi:hypothetical protein
LNEIGALDNIWKPCRIDSFGLLPSGEFIRDISCSRDASCIDVLRVSTLKT